MSADLPVSPGDEYDVTFLCIKREIFDVESTIRLDECRVQPQYLPTGRHNSIRYHEVIKLITSTEKQKNFLVFFGTSIGANDIFSTFSSANIPLNHSVP